jgi:trans-aconitate 2-methyltransferase
VSMGDRSTVWDPERYLQFERERSRPLRDLLERIDHPAATAIADLGCGPGNDTPLLRARWPAATIDAIDASPEMIERAKATNTDAAVTYGVRDVRAWAPSSAVDIVVSNALFQWVPAHRKAIVDASEFVRPGGYFAFQVPGNQGAPSHMAIKTLAADPEFSAELESVRTRDAFAPEVYADDFLRRQWEVEAWETTYVHVLRGADPIFDWLSGTGLRPYLQTLSADATPRFADRLKRALREAYPATKAGVTLLPFRRIFVVARRRS